MNIRRMSMGCAGPQSRRIISFIPVALVVYLVLHYLVYQPSGTGVFGFAGDAVQPVVSDVPSSPLVAGDASKTSGSSDQSYTFDETRQYAESRVNRNSPLMEVADATFDETPKSRSQFSFFDDQEGEYELSESGTVSGSSSPSVNTNALPSNEEVLNEKRDLTAPGDGSDASINEIVPMIGDLSEPSNLDPVDLTDPIPNINQVTDSKTTNQIIIQQPLVDPDNLMILPSTVNSHSPHIPDIIESIPLDDGGSGPPKSILGRLQRSDIIYRQVSSENFNNLILNQNMIDTHGNSINSFDKVDGEEDIRIHGDFVTGPISGDVILPPSRKLNSNSYMYPSAGFPSDDLTGQIYSTSPIIRSPLDPYGVLVPNQPQMMPIDSSNNLIVLPKDDKSVVTSVSSSVSKTINGVEVHVNDQKKSVNNASADATAVKVTPGASKSVTSSTRTVVKKTVKKNALSIEYLKGPHKVGDLYTPGFAVAHEDVCPNNGRDLKVAVFITSAPNHERHRTAVRQTWGHFALRRDVVMLFMVGRTDKPEVQTMIDNENERYGDIIQSNVIDHYRNLTLKSTAMFEWIKTYCSEVPFVLKTDDDMYINMPLLFAFIDSKHNEKRVMYGRLGKGWKPVRSKRSKYYVDIATYAKSTYPPFVTGPAYLFTSDIVEEIYNQILNTDYLFLEDVFITGIIGEYLKIRRIADARFRNDKIKLTDTCRLMQTISIHMVKYEEQFDIYKRTLDGKTKCKPK